MPVERFRTFEDARRAGWLEPGDPKLARRMAWVFAWTTRMAREAPPRGVQRFRTIEAANEARERRIQQRVDTLRAEHGEDLFLDRPAVTRVASVEEMDEAIGRAVRRHRV